MGRFFGPPAPGDITSSGYFGPLSAPSAAPQFMVVGANNTNPNTADGCGASIRDTGGHWHPVDTTALGARGAFGVMRDPILRDRWYITTNFGLGNAVIGVVVDGSLVATAVDTGLANHLSDLSHGNGLFNIATLDNLVITSPDMSFGSFTAHGNHGAGSYTATGIAGQGGAGQAVTVGLGSAGTGICTSADSVNWTQLGTLFVTNADSFVTSNTVVWDGAFFNAVGQSKVVTSPDGLSWAVTSLAAITTTANVIGYDIGNQTGAYIMGDRNGNAFVATGATAAALAGATAIPLHSGSLRCATVLAATLPGIYLLGDDAGHIYSSIDGGATWITEDPGLGTLVLTSLASTATP